MANFFVSATRGSNSTGTGTATNPWATIGKAIGTSPAITLSGSGTDRLYIEPGTYYESVTLALTPSSGNPFEIIGDCDGAGFLAGGYSTPVTGLVDWSAWSNDTTALTSSTLVGATKSYVSLRMIKMHGGSTNVACVSISTGTNWTITDCNLITHVSGFAAIDVTSAGVGLNLIVTRCDLHSGVGAGAPGIRIVANEAASEYDLASSVTNCRFFGAGGSPFGVRFDRGTTGPGFLGTGLTITGNTFLNLETAIRVYSGVTTAITTASQIVGNIFYRCGKGITNGATSQSTEDYNAFSCTTPRTLVNTGTNSTTGTRPALDFNDGLLTGLPLRPWGEPVAGSPLGAFVASGFPSVDRTNRARPEGYGSTSAAVGALQRHDTGVRNATYQDTGSTACLELAGPSSQERPVLVDAASTTITVKVRWDGNHADTNKPQAMILANPEIGVAAQTVTATSTGGSGSTPNSFETLTFTGFTPSAKGVVILRLVSRSAAGNGKAYFDTIGIT